MNDYTGAVCTAPVIRSRMSRRLGRGRVGASWTSGPVGDNLDDLEVVHLQRRGHAWWCNDPAGENMDEMLRRGLPGWRYSLEERKRSAVAGALEVRTGYHRRRR